MSQQYDPSSRRLDEPTAVFICAAGHSGSTLLDLLLGSHPAAMSLGEITQLPKNLALNTQCSCGSPARECAIWSRVVAELAADERFRDIRQNPYVLNLGLFEASTVVDRTHQTPWRRIYRRLTYAGAFAHWRWGAAPLAACTAPLTAGARNKLVLFRVVSESVAKPILIDSSKHYLEAAALYGAAPERTKVLLLVRDGRAVFYSRLKRGHSRRIALKSWRDIYSRALPVLSRQVGARNLLRVRYEDLVANPAQELHRICEFIGIGYDVGMLDFRSRAHHVLNGNDMRLARSGTIRMDDAWKNKLTAPDLDYFEARAGKLNRDLGYSSWERT